MAQTGCCEEQQKERARGHNLEFYLFVCVCVCVCVCVWEACAHMCTMHAYNRMCARERVDTRSDNKKYPLRSSRSQCTTQDYTYTTIQSRCVYASVHVRHRGSVVIAMHTYFGVLECVCVCDGLYLLV